MRERMALACDSLLLPVLRTIAALLAATGAFMIAFGGAWAPPALAALSKMPFGGWLTLALPFLPMVPLLAAARLAGLCPPRLPARQAAASGEGG